MLSNKIKDDKHVDTLLSKGAVPIIDLAHAGTDECPVKSVLNRVARQLEKSLSEKGLAILVNHGITEEKLKVAWAHLDDFVKLPNDVKEKYLRQTDTNHGYIRPGQERFDGKTPELRHAFNICTLKLSTLPEEPLPGFRDHIAEIAKDFKNLSSTILQALAITLELPLDYFIQKHSHMLSGDNDNATTLRLLYYPPLVEDDNKCELVKGQMLYSYQRCAMDRPDLGLNMTDDLDEDDKLFTRCGAHIDYGTFTLLAQDSEGGLEAKLPNSEKWQRIGHLPGAILVNTGEILAKWTSDKYPALPHRVVIPEQVHIRSRGRHSITFFCHPDNDTEIAPIELPSSSATLSDNVKTKKPFKTKILDRFKFKSKKV
jgi:isopenicillin N synthase-like dioxygenase